jgi:hypothetical protein
MAGRLRKERRGLRGAVPPRIMVMKPMFVEAMSSDAAPYLQFAPAQLASARVLAALPRLSSALSGYSAFAPASQPLR